MTFFVLVALWVGLHGQANAHVEQHFYSLEDCNRAQSSLQLGTSPDKFISGTTVYVCVPVAERN